MVETAEAMICKDSSPSWFAVELTAGDGAFVRLTRMQGVTWWRDWGSDERWSIGNIAGRDAVFKEQVIPGELWDTTVIVVGPESDGSTRIKGRDTSATLQLLTSIAEELYR